MISNLAKKAVKPTPAVAVVLLRELKSKIVSMPGHSDYEVLLVQRGKEPNKGAWSFPGGSLELGETVVEGAIRELKEETGVRLDSVEPFHATDAIIPKPSGESGWVFHYCIVQCMGIVKHTFKAEPVAADDAMDAQWVRCDDIESKSPLVPLIKGTLQKAIKCAAFDIGKQ
ncbi:hypothetical protein SARC_07475 [Sphaeroforma arctica JP610]|uniref:Nudix hydrolase domain-containing protein n=1 Tax=Sphaeroforma arctica JP610 TaxID=667725 RepID=A0A0L0FTN6_9EUKA|nr:hypothetical protein SARC_07475 [Sphaeroforma arctica JP610]KNC80162.1 hypothetical protein SARC_07475 [Sphaeroforma arctica JP610]|eukprot:XP_014154064.1 hypothetical protein SARC_07475 [Sphaeroforma arctica JP610]